jgi:hypothetical protein
MSVFAEVVEILTIGQKMSRSQARPQVGLSPTLEFNRLIGFEEWNGQRAAFSRSSNLLP